MGTRTGKGTRDGVRRLGAGMAIAWSLAACEGLLGFASFEEPPRGDAAGSEGGVAPLDGAATLEGSVGDGAGASDAKDDTDAALVDASTADGDAQPTLVPPCSVPGSLVCLPFDTDFQNHGSLGAGPLLTVGGMAMTPGKSASFRDAGLFSAASTVAFFGATAAFLTAEVTIDAWVRRDVDAAMYILDVDGYVGVSLNASGNLICSTTLQSVPTTASVPLGVWTHVACVFGASQGPAPWMAGVASTPGGLPAATDAAAGPVAVGANSPALTSRFVGALDEVRYFTRALSQAEIVTAAAR